MNNDTIVCGIAALF